MPTPTEMEKLPPLDFHSFLASAMVDYLDYLDQLGFSIVQQAHNLRRLDRLLVQHHIQETQQLNATLMMRWVDEDRARVRAHTLRLYRDTFRRFCRYLIRRGGIDHPPLDSFPTPRPQPYSPHVFSPRELGLFFDELKQRVLQAPDQLRWLRAFSHYTLYHLLYACGLRVSEAIRLRPGDYSAPQATLYIRPSKFRKDRLLPVSQKVGRHLNNLLTVRQPLLTPTCPNRLFLLWDPPRAYPRLRVSAYFRQLLRHLGLYYPSYCQRGIRYGTPHLHELRRAFAVHRLLRWYRQGADVEAKLPLLATYMGHAYFGHTKTYLSLTQQLLRQADQRFAQQFDRLDWLEHDSSIL